MSIIIKNATIIHPDQTIQADIRIEEEKIVEIGTINEIEHPHYQLIDSTGFFVFPGGIDPHVHMQLPTPTGNSADDFVSGSIAALFGGTTTFIDFVTPKKNQSLVEALYQRIDQASGSFVDYSFHVSPIGWNANTASEIEECVQLGFPSFKVYMAYKQSVGIDEKVLFKVMQAVAQAGGIVAIHCEMGDEIDRLRQLYVSEGKTSPLYHPLSRPNYTESDAVKIAIEIAAQIHCPIYIVHVSTAESLKYIQTAQQNGQQVYAETCPHYLLLTDEKYEGDFEHTAPFVMSPPLRKKADQNALWKAISNGTINTIGTDHCPFTLSQKAAGKDDFTLIPNGVGGVEHRLQLVYSEGLRNGKIKLDRFVQLISSNVAQLFQLPGKGQLEIGADADLVLWNPNKVQTISSTSHHSKCDGSIYEGMTTTGDIEMVLKSGEVVIEKNQLVKQIPGKLLFRKPNDSVK